MSKKTDVKNFVERRLRYISNIPDLGRQRAVLAELRRGAGEKPGALPRLWGLIFEDLPENLASVRGEPSPAERAIYAALTLYALHQQGKDPATESMHRPKVGVGAAAGEFAGSREDSDGIQRRFNAFAVSADIDEASAKLRGLIGLLKSRGIGFDYAALASDLYEYQFYEGAQSVRLDWGRDFYRSIYKKENNKED